MPEMNRHAVHLPTNVDCYHATCKAAQRSNNRQKKKKKKPPLE
jgi:hypothetical protein